MKRGRGDDGSTEGREEVTRGSMGGAEVRTSGKKCIFGRVRHTYVSSSTVKGQLLGGYGEGT